MNGGESMNRLIIYIRDFFQIRRLIAFLYILIFLAIGEMIKYFTAVPLAGNIIGMLLLFISLKLKWVKLEDIKPASDKLLEFLIIFFIPYGVGLMVYVDLIAGFWLPLSIALVLSTLLTLYITAVIMEKFGK